MANAATHDGLGRVSNHSHFFGTRSTRSIHHHRSCGKRLSRLGRSFQPLATFQVEVRRKVYGVLRLGRRRAPELVNERAAAWKGIGSGSSEVTLFFRFGNLSAATMPPGATT